MRSDRKSTHLVFNLLVHKLMKPGRMVLIALALLALVPVAFHVRVASRDGKSTVAIDAGGRGKPYFNFREGREMQVSYRGDERVTAALRSGNAQPRALASIDFDRNGTPDVVAGYSYNGGGILTLQRGNPDAFAPADDSVFPRLQQGYNPDSLLPGADVIAVPEPVDFLQVGDFDHDNQRDVLVAALGGGMFLLSGDARGGLRSPQAIALPGRVTSMTAGEFRAPDGWTDVAVTVSSAAGSELIVFDGEQGIGSEPMRWSLSAPATAVEFGEIDSTPFRGVVVAAGDRINVIHGWGRKHEPELTSRVETLDAGANVRGLATGLFVWTREAEHQIAALSEDGTIRILERGQANTQPFTEAELTERARRRLRLKKDRVDVEALPGWEATRAESWNTVREVVTGNFVGENATAQNFLQRTHVSFVTTDDLVVLGANQQRLDIVRQVDEKAGPNAAAETTAGDMFATRLSTTGSPRAVLALPQKLNGERSLLVLQAGSTAPVVVPLAPTATITVDRTDDVAAASACTAGANDCSLRGAVTHANGAPGTVIQLATATYVLGINGSNGCVNENTVTGNTIGDLETNVSTTFMGNGQANTIIRQGAATNDRVLCMNVPLTSNLSWTFSGMTIAGGRDVNSNVGGGGFIGGARDNSITLTNVTFANNQTTGPNISGGGGVAVTGGSMTITNCTFGAANAPGADRTNLTLANASNSNSGGGLSYSPGDPAGVGGATGSANITGTTFMRNTTSSGSAGGGGIVLFNFNLSTGTASLGTSSFSNNQATGTASGGGFNNESLTTVTVATTSFTSNFANNRGGGIYVGGGTVVLDGTSPSITFTGNTATSGGGSVSTAAVVNVSGTNTSIGGDIEITTNAIWTNNAGSTLAPTNVVLVGGTFTCNNSTMNVGGNLSISSGPVVGGTFNANSAAINIAGNLSYSTGPATPAFNAGTSTFTFNGTAAQSITNNASITFNNLTNSNVTNPLTLNNNLAVNGTLNVNGSNAVLAPVAGAVISGTGTLTGTGTARVTKTSATADFNSQYTIANKTLTNLTVEYIGAVAQVLSAITYGPLRINNASGVNLAAGTSTVNGLLTLTAGALGVGTQTLVINNGSSVGTGSITSSATGTVNYNQGSVGQSVLAFNYGNLTFSNFNKVLASTGTIGIAGTFTPGAAVGHTITGSTINFNGSTSQNIPAFNYNNLTSSSSGARTLPNGSTVGVAGTFTPGTNTYTITGSTVDFNGAGSQTIPAFNYNNLTSSNTGARSLANAGIIGIAGVFTPGTNGYTVVGSTVTFNGTALQTIPAFTFNHLTLNNAAGANLSGNVTVEGVLTLTSGALGVGTNTLNLNGMVTATGGSLTSAATGTVNYNQTGNGQATVLAANYGNLTFSNFSKVLASTGTIGIAGVFTPGSGVGHTIAGSTINFNSANPQTIPAFTYNNLTSSSTGARTLSSTGTIRIAGTFTPGTNTYTITGSTVEYNGTSAQVLPSTFTTYNNLTLNNAAGTTGFAGLTVQGLIRVQAGTFTSSSTYNNVQIDSGATMAATAASTINVSGNWTNNGTFTPGTGTVVFNGGGAQSIGGANATTFNNLTNSSASLSLGQNITVSGLLTLNADLTTNANTLTQPSSAPASVGLLFDVIGNVRRTNSPSALPANVGLTFGNQNNIVTFAAGIGTPPSELLVNMVRQRPMGAIGFPTAVDRTYTITPTSGSNYNFTLRLHYLDGELNGNTEGAGLGLWVFNGVGWAPRGQTANNTTDNWVEDSGNTHFSPWTFNSTQAPTAANGIVTGRLTTPGGDPVVGAVIYLTGTQTRKSITNSNGEYRFERVETNGFYTVTPARANFTFNPATRSFNQLSERTDAGFTGVFGTDAANPLDTPEFFVRQQYVDVLGREPDEGGFNYWSDQLLACGNNASCLAARRSDVAAAFFIEQEFQRTGSFIYGLYKGSLGRVPVFNEFTADRQQVTEGPSLEATKQAFAEAFVSRAEFIARYQSQTSAESFVDALIANVRQSSNVDLAGQRSAAIDGYNAGANFAQSRANAVRLLLDGAAFRQAEYNSAFVLTEYFSYLRRDPEPAGYAFWLHVLNNQDPGNFRGMVCAFINSAEYQGRFSGIISHTDLECR